MPQLLFEASVQFDRAIAVHTIVCFDHEATLFSSHTRTMYLCPLGTALLLMLQQYFIGSWLHLMTQIT